MEQIIGQKIKEARLKSDLTQKELGERLGISESAVNKLENRKTPPSVSTLERIAKATGSKLVIEFQ
ncbi:helix-turn-helix transcriptional regulator [Spirosoma litoris]